jgi:hypothetical protein
MKNLKLSVIATIVLLSGNVFASADLDGDIKRLAYVKDDSGNWTVSGYANGTVYANEMDKHYSTIYQNRANEIKNANYSKEVESQKLSNNANELSVLRERVKRDGQQADFTLDFLKSGSSLTDAQNLGYRKMVEEGYEQGFKDIFNPDDPSTSYNANSITTSIMAGDSSATNVSPSTFKQFNELDCSYDEVANYLDKTKSPKTKAFSTSPSFSGTFKKTASKSAAAVKGEDEAACQTIFHDINFEALDDLSISQISAGIPSFGDFGSMLDDLGNKAGEQLGNLASDLYGVLREGFCSRLSSDYIGELAGDLIDDEYKEQTKGTNLEGTKINRLDSEAGQNNFTYKVIKNQTELSDSNLIKAIDVTREDQSKYQQNYLGGELDDYLDDLEDDIFG